MALALPTVAQPGKVLKTSGPAAHIVIDAAAGENNRLDIYEQGGFVYVTDIGAATTAGNGCEPLGRTRCRGGAGRWAIRWANPAEQQGGKLGVSSDCGDPAYALHRVPGAVTGDHAHRE